MPLANIRIGPLTALGGSAPQQAKFDYSHFQDHLEIAQAIQRQTGVNVTIYPLHPGPTDSDQWQRMHQQMHNDMNRLLKLPQGRDFTGTIDRTWYDANWREHQAARFQLGI